MAVAIYYSKHALFRDIQPPLFSVSNIKTSANILVDPCSEPATMHLPTMLGVYYMWLLEKYNYGGPALIIGDYVWLLLCPQSFQSESVCG